MLSPVARSTSSSTATRPTRRLPAGRGASSLSGSLAGGCHLTHDMSALIGGAGFKVERLDTYYMKGEPKSMGYTYEGIAQSN